ncbi:metallophosphoesterase [Paucibacter sp. KBW04]|uniref:metallophosphoesterase n=1 Tax=Paucibacter sp. KBW04 TaxID=2153361 RepID=UPI001E2CCC9C|nr:metallophosphoesterase [Paucibacter sp. KBW04]
MIESLPPQQALDIVGDVHGEFEALCALLAALGYDEQGRHAQGRRLVFVGDLCDRGPDSPAVIRWVQRSVEAGRAQMVLGNHELNLLRGARKAGNDWFWAEGRASDQKFGLCAQATADDRAEFLDFFSRQPLALSRADIRVSHAAWHGQSLAHVQALSALRSGLGSFADWFARLDAHALASQVGQGWHELAQQQKALWRAHFQNPQFAMPRLDALGHLDAARQMLNPLRVLTSGLERKAPAPFFASGLWRFAERVAWWDEYQEETPVVVGHYWRQFLPLDRAQLGKEDADLFAEVAPTQWLGQRANVFCVDFSVGGRYQERLQGQAGACTRLAALRWPERELMLDTGERLTTTGYRAASHLATSQLAAQASRHDDSRH